MVDKLFEPARMILVGRENLGQDEISAISLLHGPEYHVCMHQLGLEFQEHGTTHWDLSQHEFYSSCDL